MADDAGYTLSRNAVEKTAATVRRVSGSAYVPPPPATAQDHFDQRWEPFYNNSGEIIPSYGVVAFATGFLASESGPIPYVVKPSTVFRRMYGVNSGLPVAAGECGMCVTSGHARILYESGAAVTADVSCGPKPDQWGLAVNWPETTIVRGVISSTQLTLWGSINARIESVLFKTTAAIAANTTATVTIYTGAHGSEAESSPRISLGTRNRGASVSFTTGIFGKVTWINGQPWS